MEINRLTITTESRILGDEYVRFGGEYIETCFHKGKKGALCLAIGGGKTMIMCVASYEMKRIGVCNKPMIIGLKANVHEIAATYRKAIHMLRFCIQERMISNLPTVRNCSSK